MKAGQGMRTAAALGALWVVSQAGAATVRVTGGEWRLLGHVAATQLLVEGGAVLGGTGTVHGATVMRGAAAPGQTAGEVGKLNFAGGLAFEGGVFSCDVAASNSLDRLSVTGTVSGTATVQVIQASGAYPEQEVIVEGNAASDYSAFALSPEAGWRLGESGALDLWLGAEPSLGVLGTNGAVIASGEAASREKGTAIGPLVIGAAWTNTLIFTNDGNAVLDITDVRTNGADSGFFTITGVPASIPIGGAALVTVAYTPAGPASHAAALVISNTSPTNPFTIHLTGSCYALSTNNGPYAGGNMVVLTNGHYGTITNVTVGGTAAAILNSGSNWVAFTAPAVGSAGVKDLRVQTSNNGDHEVPGAYTVNPAGSIASVDPLSGSWTGNYPVVLSGANLGNGSDITNVTLCGVAAAIGSQSATQVVVTAGGAGAVGIGDVRVVSTSHGETIAAGAFEYLRDPQASLGFAPASPQAYGTTNGLSATGGSGTGAVSYAVAGGPGVIAGGTNLAVTAGSGAIEVVATKAQDDFYTAAAATATVTAIKSDQLITNFLPPDGKHFVLGFVTGLSAQASSGLAVGFVNLAPEVALLAGTNITFTNTGLARVRAEQAGDANWNAAVSVTNSWPAGSRITNVTPGAANVGGGIAVLIQGQWLGDGTDITNVTLAGVAAAVVAQGADEVTVTAGVAPGTVTGDVRVASVSSGTTVRSNAFEYLWLDAPVQLDPVDITPTNLVARWELVPAASRHVLDAGTDTNFAAYVPGYEKLDVALAEQYAVEGLADGTWYALRLFAWNADGYSWPSRTVWVPTGTNTPYETHPPRTGPVSQGAVMDHSLSNLFHGAGLVYAAESSDTNVMTVAVGAGGRLIMEPIGPGTAEITVSAMDPATGYTSTYSFMVTVVGAPALDADDFLPREPWNPRFTQALEVRNDSGLDAIGVRVLFTNLMPGIAVENQTGTSSDGRPMIEMQTAFTNGAALTLNIVYVCTGAYRADAYSPAIELQYILPEWTPPLPGEGTVLGDGYPLPDGRYVIQFDSVPGRLYAVEYRIDFPGGEWVEVPLRLRATANRTQWIDAGPPATQPSALGQIRAYRVKEVAE